MARITIEQIKNLTPDVLEHLSIKELATMARDVGVQVERRVERLEKYKDVYAVPVLKEDFKHFETTLAGLSGKNAGQLKKEILRGKSFIESKTSTVSGAIDYTEKLEQAFGVEWSEITEDEKTTFWDVYTAYYNAGGMVGSAFKNLDSKQRFAMVKETINKAGGLSRALSLAHGEIEKAKRNMGISAGGFDDDWSTDVGGNKETTAEKTIFNWQAMRGNR